MPEIDFQVLQQEIQLLRKELKEQHKQAHSREMTMHADALAGGQHELMQALIAIQTWDFHNGQQGDERWQQMVSFMNAMQRFADDVMTYLAQKDPELFQDSGN